MDREHGFIEIARQEPGYRPVEERLRDFKPVEVRLANTQILQQAARCMDCGTPFCHGYGCPVGNVAPELHELVYAERWQEALGLLLSTNNFPEFTARVCPALCEASCVLGIDDEPVTIRQIELAVIEKAFADGYMGPRPPRGRRRERVAVIGSGPAGLAVADTLNRRGFGVTVYDRARHAGGVLRYGIPDFKLEKSVVDRRLALMQEEGVEFELGLSAGDDVSHRYLRQRFDAICLAGGARLPRDLQVPGRELRGIHFAMDYLTQQNMKLSGEELAAADDIVATGKRVAVIGGGDTGSDCVGTALRQGAATVTQFEILPRPPEERPEHTPWPMWPDIMRSSSSHEEGGERRWSVTTQRFYGSDGHVTGMHCAEVDCSGDGQGRISFAEREGTEFEAEAGLVLLAMGFLGPAPDRLVDQLGVQCDGRGNIRIDDNHMTSVEGVFAAGDMARGQSLVVRAIADGRETAKGIAVYLSAGIQNDGHG